MSSLPNRPTTAHHDAPTGSRQIRAALLVVAGLVLASGLQARIGPGDRFPTLTDAAYGLEGDLAAAHGEVMLVDFWASWCTPCKASFPAYTELDRTARPRGLRIIAVSVDKDPAAFQAFIRKMQPSFVILRDKDQQLVRLVDVPAMPTCFLIGRDGRVRFVHAGYHGAESDQALRREVDILLAEKPLSP